MELIKIKEDHFVVVDNSEIKKGDWILDITDNTFWECLEDMSNTMFPECKKITHSTKPFGGQAIAISIHDIKTLTYEKPNPKLIDSMAMRYRHDFGLLNDKEKESIRTTMKQLWEEVVGLGFYKNEDSEYKKYTKGDLINALYSMWHKANGGFNEIDAINETVKYIQPKTIWEIEFDESGKIKLK